jgi:hypothetical protein
LLNSRDGKFISDAAVSGWYVLNDGVLAVKCTVDVSVEFECDRCLTPTVINLSVDVSETFLRKRKKRIVIYTRTKGLICCRSLKRELFLAVPTRVLCKRIARVYALNAVQILMKVAAKQRNAASRQSICGFIGYEGWRENSKTKSLDKNITSGGKKNGSTKV